MSVSEKFVYNVTDWKSISLTHVEYPKGDLVGLVLAWTSLVPIFLLVSFGTLIVFRRDLHTISYLFGLLLNEGLNWFLKHTIKEQRPVRGADRAVLFTEYGMPSSHAQFIWFFSSYLVLFLFIRVHHNINKLENIWKYLTALGAIALSAIVCVSRVYLGYHSQRQVLWGGTVGVLSGAVWFIIVHFVLTPFFPTVASWRVSELLMLRDSTLIPNVLWFEYTSTRNEARSRHRKSLVRKASGHNIR